MRVIVLTEEVEKSISFVLDAAMKFVGYPTVNPHYERIIGAISNIPEKTEEEKVE